MKNWLVVNLTKNDAMVRMNGLTDAYAVATAYFTINKLTCLDDSIEIYELDQRSDVFTAKDSVQVLRVADVKLDKAF